MRGAMNLRDILVFLDPTDDNQARLKLALDLAQAHGARLIGVEASSEDAFLGKWRERAIGVQAEFEAAVNAAGLAGTYRSLNPSKPAADLQITHYADLIIAPQPEFEMRGLVVAPVPEDVVLMSGVPMIVVPSFWKHRPVGESIVIAWNASREATRAVHDAMPLLAKARQVTIFTVAANAEAARSGSEFLVDHLKQHGVTAQTSYWPSVGDATVVDGLFACLDTQDADLIVAGAYGHSRWVESLFGGVSRDLIRQPSMPVLMSH
jgi:nucleotide-binding universal stress UspA family protein